MSELPIPVIDLSRAKTDRTQLAKEVVHALENIGFLYIDNVKGIDFDKLFKICQWFFGLPIETKMDLTRKNFKSENHNLYRGYFPVVEGEPSRKEGFEFARDVPADDKTVSSNNWMYEKSVWPEENFTVAFKEFLQNMYEIVHETSQEILRLAALGLGIEEHAFEHLFSDKPCSTFRIMHYPPWEGTPPKNAIIEDGKVVTTPEHMDSDFLTLLHIFNYDGLEVLDMDGTWIAVPPRPNSLIMNIGVTFSRMMAGRFKATRHRVLDIGKDRFSVPFFLSPSFDSDIGVNFMSKFNSNGPEHVPEKFGPWLLHRIKHEIKYFEYRDLPEIED
ncbi:isopenicillin N synthase-like [Mytilus galloprovincialis]|uniref:isopenicillin N synthase-like n=1 Tax=Mytilus galloprovincialis TaxID=29158 RepID=UPI003F7B7BAD